MELTLKQIASRLESLAKSHRQINTVFVGDIEDFLTTTADIIYPACVISIMPESSIDIANFKHQYNIKMQFYDLLQLADNSIANQLELQSDLSSLAGDLVAMINYEEYLQDWQVPESYTLRIADFQLSDVCVGVYFDLPVAAFYATDRCQVPAEGIPFENDNSVKTIVNTRFIVTSESENLLLTSMVNKDILMLFLGDKLLTPTNGVPTVNEYKYTLSTGLFEFGTTIQVEQVIQILNRPI